MLTNNEYKEIVEKKFKKPLKEIMYEICIERGMEKWDGAKELGVPEDTFVRWRTNFRFGPLQYQADMAQKHRIETINKYKQELKNTDLERDLVYKDEVSLKGFKEIAERMLELKKMQSADRDIEMSNLMDIMSVGIWESIIEYLDKYENGSLLKQYEQELEYIVKYVKQ